MKRCLRAWGSLLLLTLLGGCVSYQPRQLTPSVTLSPETLALAGSGREGNGADLGLEAGVNESDSLFNVATLPGVRIRSVVANGPAAQAGLIPGDIILTVNGTATDHPDALAAIAAGIDSPDPLRLEVRRDSAVLEASLTPRLRAGSTAILQELYRVDPVASRAGFRTETVSVPGRQDQLGARLVAFFPDSPLPAAGLQHGDLVVALDGQTIASAQGLINRLNQDFDPGRRVVFSVMRDGTPLELPVRLWDPGRRVSEVSLGPLLRYESSLSPDRTRFSLLDLWLFSVYRYTRDGGERQHSLLGVFNFTSDYGALQETGP